MARKRLLQKKLFVWGTFEGATHLPPCKHVTGGIERRIYSPKHYFGLDLDRDHLLMHHYKPKRVVWSTPLLRKLHLPGHFRRERVRRELIFKEDLAIIIDKPWTHPLSNPYGPSLTIELIKIGIDCKSNGDVPENSSSLATTSAVAKIVACRPTLQRVFCYWDAEKIGRSRFHVEVDWESNTLTIVKKPARQRFEAFRLGAFQSFCGQVTQWNLHSMLDCYSIPLSIVGNAAVLHRGTHWMIAITKDEEQGDTSGAPLLMTKTAIQRTLIGNSRVHPVIFIPNDKNVDLDDEWNYLYSSSNGNHIWQSLCLDKEYFLHVHDIHRRQWMKWPVNTIIKMQYGRTQAFLFEETTNGDLYFTNAKDEWYKVCHNGDDVQVVEEGPDPSSTLPWKDALSSY
ncbi:unnamed protein product [Sympodiomycopsis kandeliae]